MDVQSLKYFSGIDWFDRYKTKNMCYMLNECPSLISTQNIYKYTVFLEIIPLQDGKMPVLIGRGIIRRWIINTKFINQTITKYKI